MSQHNMSTTPTVIVCVSSLPLVYSKVYKTPDVPRVVLNKLAQRGYRVISSVGVGQTCIWTLYKEEGTP